MPGWRCFLARPSAHAQHYLRRYASTRRLDGKPDTPCPLRHGYHNAVAVFETIACAEPPCTQSAHTTSVGWPLRCGCGYVFKDDDAYQDGWQKMWTADGMGLFPANAPPIGAMWTEPDYADISINNRDQPGWPLVVQTPAGYVWTIDAKSSNGNGWQRNGIPPNVTATPSIKQEGYHSWLTDGILGEDCEGQTFPGVPRTA